MNHMLLGTAEVQDLETRGILQDVTREGLPDWAPLRAGDILSWKDNGAHQYRIERFLRNAHSGQVMVILTPWGANRLNTPVMHAPEVVKGAVSSGHYLQARPGTAAEAVSKRAGFMDPFALDDPWHPFPGNGYMLNELEFPRYYGMSIEEYEAECKRRGVPTVRRIGTSENGGTGGPASAGVAARDAHSLHRGGTFLPAEPGTCRSDGGVDRRDSGSSGGESHLRSPPIQRVWPAPPVCTGLRLHGARERVPGAHTRRSLSHQRFPDHPDRVEQKGRGPRSRPAY